MPPAGRIGARASTGDRGSSGPERAAFVLYPISCGFRQLQQYLTARASSDTGPMTQNLTIVPANEATWNDLEA
jgi:hypothetical protein